MGNRTVTPTPSVSEEVERVALDLLRRIHAEVMGRPVAGGDGATFVVNPLSGKTLNDIKALLDSATLRPSPQPEEGVEDRAFAAGRQQGLREAAEVAQGVLYNVHEEALGDEACAAITALIEGEGG